MNVNTVELEMKAIAALQIVKPGIRKEVLSIIPDDTFRHFPSKRMAKLYASGQSLKDLEYTAIAELVGLKVDEVIAFDGVDTTAGDWKYHVSELLTRRQVESPTDKSRWAAANIAVEEIGKADSTEPEPTIEQRRFAPRAFPFEILPMPFNVLAAEYANALQTQPEIMAMCMITVVSATIGNSVVLEIKKGWETPPFIWLAIVADTGSGKSHTVEAIMQPVKEQQGREATRHKKLMDEYNNNLTAYKADKKNNDIPTEPPLMKHYYTTNFTIEALIPMFQADARGMIIHVDELAGLFKGLNQYKGGGNDGEQMLSLFNAGDIKADRKSGGGYVRNSGAAVIGGIQYGILSQVFGESDYVNGTVMERFVSLKQLVKKTHRVPTSGNTMHECCHGRIKANSLSCKLMKRLN